MHSLGFGCAPRARKTPSAILHPDFGGVKRRSLRIATLASVGAFGYHAVPLAVAAGVVSAAFRVMGLPCCDSVLWLGSSWQCGPAPQSPANGPAGVAWSARAARSQATIPPSGPLRSASAGRRPSVARATPRPSSLATPCSLPPPMLPPRAKRSGLFGFASGGASLLSFSPGACHSPLRRSCGAQGLRYARSQAPLSVASLRAPSPGAPPQPSSTSALANPPRTHVWRAGC